MIKIKVDQVLISMAEPAPKWQVVLYLLTGGRKGRLFQEKVVSMKLYAAPEHINCRCTISATKT